MTHHMTTRMTYFLKLLSQPTMPFKKVRSYKVRNPVLGTAQSALHFTPWQTWSFQPHLDFTLHPLADQVLPTPSQLYTSPPGRPGPSNAISTLHFTPWQTWSFQRHLNFTLHPLADLVLPTPSRLLCEAFGHAAITAQRLFELW